MELRTAEPGPASCPPDRWRPPPLEKGTPEPAATGSGAETLGSRDADMIHARPSRSIHNGLDARKGWLDRVAALGDPTATLLAEQIARATPSDAAGAFIGLAELAEATGRSRSAIRRTGRRLAAAGLMQIEPGNGRGLKTLWMPIFRADGGI